MMRHSVYHYSKLKVTYRDELKSEVAHNLKCKLKYGEVQSGDRVVSSVNVGDKWEVQDDTTVLRFIREWGDGQ